jgi:hypothetical protein
VDAREDRRVSLSDGTALIRAGLAPFFAEGSALELRILKTPKKTVSGYFNNLDLAAKELEKATRHSTGGRRSTSR